MNNTLINLSIQRYSQENSNLAIPPEVAADAIGLANADALRSSTRQSTYGRINETPKGEKLKHNQNFARRLRNARPQRKGLALDGAGLTTSTHCISAGVDLHRLIVPNPCSSGYDGVGILKKRLKESAYARLCQVFMTLQKFLSLNLPAVNALRNNLAVVWFDLMNSANNMKVKSDLLLPFFERKWLANEEGSTFAITLSLRGIKKIHYKQKEEFWKQEILEMAKNNGYSLRYLQDEASVYKNNRSNLLYLSFEVVPPIIPLKRAPKGGITINGKTYKGGQFLPK